VSRLRTRAGPSAVAAITASALLLCAAGASAQSGAIRTVKATERQVRDCTLRTRIQRNFLPRVLSPRVEIAGADEFRGGGRISCRRVHSSLRGTITLSVGGAAVRTRSFSRSGHGSGAWVDNAWWPSDFGGGFAGLCWHYQALLTVRVDQRAPRTLTTGPPLGLCDQQF
jgi:hypothetical protein